MTLGCVAGRDTRTPTLRHGEGSAAAGLCGLGSTVKVFLGCPEFQPCSVRLLSSASVSSVVSRGFCQAQCCPLPVLGLTEPRCSWSVVPGQASAPARWGCQEFHQSRGGREPPCRAEQRLCPGDACRSVGSRGGGCWHSSSPDKAPSAAKGESAGWGVAAHTWKGVTRETLSTVLTAQEKGQVLGQELSAGVGEGKGGGETCHKPWRVSGFGSAGLKVAGSYLRGFFSCKGRNSLPPRI